MAKTVVGTVIAVHGPLVRVQVGDKTMVVACRRRLTWEGAVPEVGRVVVGDEVVVAMLGSEGVVEAVKARRSFLQRRAPRSRRAQLLAANVDQALIVFAARLPEPKPGLLDRFLVACHLAGIEGVIVINKADQGTDEVAEWLPTYRAAGYAVLVVAARTGRGLGEIKRRLAGRTTLFCGPSGAGKSSLLNAVYPGFKLKVGSISEATGKGRHVTTRAELMPLPFGGFVVDTPGLKEFGVWRPARQELEAAFPELRERASGCRFSGCTHIHEPGCPVQDAVASGEIAASRFATYANILAETDEDQEAWLR